MFITSHVALHPSSESAPEHAVQLEGLAVVVTPAEGEKCERCWVITPEVGHDEAHPTLCTRCATVVKQEVNA
ncbi:zinc finger domain-containing protein [Aneurinibacillus sp. UBA3580]|uniref:zinc finger domain-containing protein n=1 Tax=Aneurinibacillus sp. UBA3580 TaxID=1946041 RepID=UPI00257A1611|nr:zinc finger domain-containing protein [Aneurinibacillus sp. UBA3580]